MVIIQRVKAKPYLVAIQDSMGWSDYHLHHFEIRGKHKRGETHIGIPEIDGLLDLKEVYPGWEIPVFVYFNDMGVEAKYLYDYVVTFRRIRDDGELGETLVFKHDNN